MVLPCSRSDPLKHLSAQCLPGDSSNRVDSILLLSDVAYPLQEDVLHLGDVHVPLLPCHHRTKRRLEVLLDLIAVFRRSVQRLSQ